MVFEENDGILTILRVGFDVKKHRPGSSETGKGGTDPLTLYLMCGVAKPPNTFTANTGRDPREGAVA